LASSLFPERDTERKLSSPLSWARISHSLVRSSKTRPPGHLNRSLPGSCPFTYPCCPSSTIDVRAPMAILPTASLTSQPPTSLSVAQTNSFRPNTPSPELLKIKSRVPGNRTSPRTFMPVARGGTPFFSLASLFPRPVVLCFSNGLADSSFCKQGGRGAWPRGEETSG